MSISPHNLFKKIATADTDIAICTFDRHLGNAENLDALLIQHKNKDICYLWCLPKWFNTRGGDDDIISKNYFVIDLDIRKEMQKQRWTVITQEQLLKYIDDIKGVLATDPLFSQRSFIICSGNGAHIIFVGKHLKISKQLYKAGVQFIYNKFTKTFKDSIPFPLDSSCSNIWKLLRCPGSINCKQDFVEYGISQMPCEILYEQDVESELFNNIPMYGEAILNSPKPTPVMKPNTTSAPSRPSPLMEAINKKPLTDLVCKYTGWALAPDNKNFVGGNNETYKWCFMHESNNNVLVMDGTNHIPNPNQLKWHTTYTFIRDALCNDPSQIYVKAKELYPDLKNIPLPEDEEVDPRSHFKTFWDLLEEAKLARRDININNVCRYGIRILDEYLWGVLPSELVVIGADTGIWKSEIAYIMALHNATRGKKVLLFGLEGDINEVALRYIQKWIAATGTPIKTVEYRFNLNPKIYDIEDQVIAAVNENVKSNLLIFNKLQIPSLKFLKGTIEKMKDTVDIVVIDHLHYIHLDQQEELRQIGDIMRTLKTLTDIIKKPVILISHVRKKDPKNKDRDLEVSDLYGSSNVWKEATTVLLLSRMSAASTWVVGIELPEQDLDKRYLGTKIIIAKSRVWLPKSAFWLIYDLHAKCYMDKFQWLLENESWAKEDDKIVNLDSIKV